jgi:hypothetical protein
VSRSFVTSLSVWNLVKMRNDNECF